MMEGPGRGYTTCFTNIIREFNLLPLLNPCMLSVFLLHKPISEPIPIRNQTSFKQFSRNGRGGGAVGPAVQSTAPSCVYHRF